MNEKKDFFKFIIHALIFNIIMQDSEYIYYTKAFLFIFIFIKLYLYYTYLNFFCHFQIIKVTFNIITLGIFYNYFTVKECKKSPIIFTSKIMLLKARIK